jgi:CBS domain-containing protein
MCARCAWANEVLELQPQLAAVAAAQGSAYVELRDRLVAEVSTNDLLRAAVDDRLDWRERLVARIVLERSLRGADIQALRRYDWPKDPEFDPMWLQYVTGFAYDMGPLAYPRLHAAGLWYYYLEINWKDTQETTHKRFGKQLAEVWPSYLLRAVSQEPEGGYRHRVMMDRIAADPPPDRYLFVRFYNALIEDRCSDAVPVLLANMDALIKNTWPSNLSEDQISRADRSEYVKVAGIADQRHVDMLSKCINERPALIEYRAQLDEIRQRPAREAGDSEPPFRLMPTPEFLKTGPFAEDVVDPYMR